MLRADSPRLEPGHDDPRHLAAEAIRFAAATSLTCFILVGCGGANHQGGTRRPRSTPRAASAANGPVVLGSKNFILWGGGGFGTAHPSELVVGGDPSVKIVRIRWHDWGHREASGVGLYAPPQLGRGGGYYSKHFRADLRVSGIGRCHSNGPRTYMALKVRVALQPGQRPSWYEANGSHGLCSYP
jgi:hypothetical protein